MQKNDSAVEARQPGVSLQYSVAIVPRQSTISKHVGNTPPVGSIDTHPQSCG